MGPGKTFVYGKRKPFEVGVVREYECLHAGPDLSPEALGAFWSLSAGFTWKSSVDQEVLDPVVATMVLTDPPRLLVCRVLDDGSDNIGRSHLLRVEGVELPLNPAGEERAVALSDPGGWSVGEPFFSVALRPGFVPTLDGKDELTARVPGNWVILGKPGTFWFNAGAMDPSQSSIMPLLGDKGNAGTNPGPWPADLPFPGLAGTPSRRDPPIKSGVLRAGLTWILLASSLLTSGLGFHYRQKMTEIQVELVEKSEDLSKAIKNLRTAEADVASLNNKITDHIVENTKKGTKISQLEATNKTYVGQVRELEKEIKRLQNESATPDGPKKTIEDLKYSLKVLKRSIQKGAEDLASVRQSLDTLIQEMNRILMDQDDLGGSDKDPKKSAKPRPGGDESPPGGNLPAGKPGSVVPANSIPHQ